VLFINASSKKSRPLDLNSLKTFEMPWRPLLSKAEPQVPTLRSHPTCRASHSHHDKHHLAYVNNANNLIKGTEFEGKSLEDVVKGSFGKNVALFNNAGQHYNHIHFWKWIKRAEAPRRFRVIWRKRSVRISDQSPI
jgi:superoxide dismutase